MRDVVQTKQAENEERHNKDTPETNIRHKGCRIGNGPGYLRYAEADDEKRTKVVSTEIVHELSGAFARPFRIPLHINGATDSRQYEHDGIQRVPIVNTMEEAPANAVACTEANETDRHDAEQKISREE